MNEDAMPSITITIESSEDFLPSDLSSYVQTLREQFEEDAAETGYPAWRVSVVSDSQIAPPENGGE